VTRTARKIQPKGGGGVLNEHTGEVYCDVCKAYLGNYLDDNFYQLIRQKYCPSCKKLIYSGQHREAERARRRRRKAERKQQAETISEFERMTQLLVEQNKLLQEQIEKLKQEERNEYKRI
jgi:uncharacterized Zn finger protein (UPF0148 family)